MGEVGVYRGKGQLAINEPLSQGARDHRLSNPTLLTAHEMNRTHGPLVASCVTEVKQHRSELASSTSPEATYVTFR
jgi:hypothetical protein